VYFEQVVDLRPGNAYGGSVAEFVLHPHLTIGIRAATGLICKRYGGARGGKENVDRKAARADAGLDQIGKLDRWSSS